MLPVLVTDGVSDTVALGVRVAESEMVGEALGVLDVDAPEDNDDVGVVDVLPDTEIDDVDECDVDAVAVAVDDCEETLV